MQPPYLQQYPNQQPLPFFQQYQPQPQFQPNMPQPQEQPMINHTSIQPGPRISSDSWAEINKHDSEDETDHRMTVSPEPRKRKTTTSGWDVEQPPSPGGWSNQKPTSSTNEVNRRKQFMKKSNNVQPEPY